MLQDFECVSERSEQGKFSYVFNQYVINWYRLGMRASVASQRKFLDILPHGLHFD